MAEGTMPKEAPDWMGKIWFVNLENKEVTVWVAEGGC